MSPFSLSPFLPLSLNYLHSFSGQVIYSNQRKLHAISKMLLALSPPPMVFYMSSPCSHLECTAHPTCPDCKSSPTSKSR